jgi:hypothetical protein
MRLLLGTLLTVTLGGVVVVAAGQTSLHRVQSGKPAVWKHYCQPGGGFCFKYPSSWSVLGEVFDGNGVMVAPPQKEDRALWGAITVAMVVPAPQGDEDPISLDGVIEQASSRIRESGQDFETLQRQQRTVDHKPAELLKVHYHEKSNGRDWIEEMVFIQGPDNEIYSVALKCSPQNLARLEPAFRQVLLSWMLPEPEPPPNATDETLPKPKTTPTVKPQ